MKTTAKTLLAVMFGLACMCRSYAAGEPKDGFMMRNGDLWITQNGDTKMVQVDMKLFDGTEVRHDGTVIIPNWGRTDLHDGDTMSFGGTITRAATGQVEMTADGVMLRDGQMLVIQNERVSAMEKPSVTMNDGTRVMKDGTVIGPNGQRRELTNGQEVLTDGRVQLP